MSHPGHRQSYIGPVAGVKRVSLGPYIGQILSALGVMSAENYVEYSESGGNAWDDEKRAYVVESPPLPIRVIFGSSSPARELGPK